MTFLVHCTLSQAARCGACCLGRLPADCVLTSETEQTSCLCKKPKHARLDGSSSYLARDAHVSFERVRQSNSRKSQSKTHTAALELAAKSEPPNGEPIVHSDHRFVSIPIEPPAPTVSAPLQAKSTMGAQSSVPSTQPPNLTGLPDRLKAGIENLSSFSLDKVKVHYNSDKPAKLQALAYVQGTDIHVAPGQEKHLPHEAWHVVQQAHGRVQPTMQMKDGVAVNDDKRLEHEADVMGAKAARLMGQKHSSRPVLTSSPHPGAKVTQRKVTPSKEIDENRLNVIGEHHSESEKRVDEERYYFKMKKLQKREENGFVIGAGDQKSFGDPPHLRLANSLVWISRYAQTLLNTKYAVTETKLDEFKSAFIDRIIPAIIKDDNQMSQIETTTGFNKQWLQTAYNQLVSHWDFLVEAHKSDDQANWKMHLSEMISNAAHYSEQIMTRQKQPTLNADPKVARSLHMHAFANTNHQEKVGWKVGEDHIQDICKLATGPVHYNLITRERFNELLIQQEYEDQGRSMSQKDIRKAWLKDGKLTE